MMESKINYNNRFSLFLYVLVLTMVVFLPSFSEAENPKIPNQFIGKWVEYNDVDKKEIPDGGTLTIKTNSMVWKRTDKYNKGEYNLKYTIADDGKTINFKTDCFYKVGSSSGGDLLSKSDMWVDITREGDNIIFESRQNRVTPAPVGSGFGSGPGTYAAMIGVGTATSKSVFKRATK